ncbi:hypothetical protein [Cytophaga aurantiaca]|uniref:hypothetical protein n=1 Tax=Cytophaga aurantiaca TaxID=29530 RepID=UPI0012F8F12A|nr:hypothetical protein [Cytophaga aurantiaca]
MIGLLFFHTTLSQAQQRYQGKTPMYPKVSFLFGAGMVSAHNHPGNLSLSFPYQTMDAGHNMYAHVFKTNTRHLLSNSSPELLFGIDITKSHVTFNFSTGFNTSYNGAFYSLGAGMNLFLGHNQRSPASRMQQAGWIIRPSLNLSFFSFTTGDIGSIDNNNVTIYVLGSTAKPKFTYYRNKHTYTGYANKLVVIYKQNQIGIEPKIAVCTNPYRPGVGVQFFASYFIPLSQSCGLVLRQHDIKKNATQFISGSSKNNLNRHDEITATYNNQRITSTPFDANYFFIGVAIVFTIQD